MNVPPDKVQQFLDDGWTIVQAAPGVQAAPVVAEQPEAEPEAAPEEAAKPTGKKSKKGS